MIIGITGTNGSGKGTVAAALRGTGFAYYSLSDVLREELAAQGVTETVDRMARLGNELREAHGPDILARRVHEAMQSDGADHAIADSIRNTHEVNYFRSRPPFILVAVDAPTKARHERVMKRNRPGDRVSLAQFIDQEMQQLMGGEAEQNLIHCMAMADVKLINDGTEDDLRARLTEGLEAFGVDLSDV